MFGFVLIFIFIIGDDYNNPVNELLRE